MSKPFVLVHGFACDHTDWRFQADHLSGNHRVFAPDLRGHGANPAPADQCSIETFGADVATLLRQHDLRDAVLVGHSMGCRVVLQAYLNEPQRVGALALVDGSWLGSGDPVAAEQRARESLAGVSFEKFAQGMFDAMFLASSPLATAVVERAKRLPAEVGLSLFPRMVGWDAANTEKSLPKVKVPLLVIQSTYLNPQRKRVSLQPGETTPWLDLVRRSVPQARIEIISGVGHFPQLEAPLQVNKLLSALV